jgi:GcrA cell cycle regulator
MSWNDEKVEAMKKLWSDGLSASQIAGRLGGVTRNAVIGKVHRLGLAGRATTSRIKHSRRIGKHQLHQWHKRKAKPKGKGKTFTFVTAPNMVRSPPIVPAALPMPAADDKARISSIKLDIQHCRWPVGDPAAVGAHEPLFCGLDRKGPPGMPVSPYCPDHHARAYAPVRPRTPPTFPMIIASLDNELEAA